MIVYVTCPDADLAAALAEGLVAAQLAAGAHLDGPIRSVYRWRGAICQRQEWRILAQVPPALFEQAREFIVARHPDVVPCIMGIGLQAAHAPFMDWINSAGATSGKASS